jgi:putative FmdB family regulatory protein
MPTYRYRCLSCKKPFELVMGYQEYGVKPAVCIYCGSENVERRIERIRVMKDDGARLQQMADPDALAGIENDPRAMGKMMRDMGNQLGEDMGPEFDEVVDRLASGQTTQEIEKDLPELSDD